MNITEIVHDKVIASTFDGTYFEKFLNNPIKINHNGEDMEIVRVVVNKDDGMVIAHLLNKEDETDWIEFNHLSNEIQGAIYADFFHLKTMDKDGFFEMLKDFIDAGDRLEVSYDEDKDGNDDYDNLVYTIYNQCNGIMGRYYSKIKVYKTF